MNDPSGMNHQIPRRKFIGQSLLAAGCLFAEPLASLDPIGASRLPAIGLIPSVIGKELKKDWQGTLRQVAETGYSYLEYGRYFGDDLAAFRKFMKEIGLKSLAGGGAMTGMMKEETLTKMIGEALALGKKYLVCYWPWMDDGNNKKIGDFQQAAANLNSIGDRCRKEGIRLAFHNHDKEFVPVEGYDWGYEVILRETDPQSVTMLMDLYWISKGGGDPIQFLDRHPGRFELFHVKDMDDSPQRLYTCPGYGTIDFPAIFRHAKKAGVRYYIVEVDEHDNGMQCIRDSYTYLKNLRF